MLSKLTALHKLKLPGSRRWQASLAALLPVSALLVGALTAAPAAAALNYLDQYKSEIPGGNGYCLDDWNYSQAAGNPVVAYPCNNSDPAQGWYSDGYALHLNYPNGYPTNTCLTVLNKQTGNGSPVGVAPCDESPEQAWDIYAADPGGGEMWNPYSGKCLDIPGYAVTQLGGPPHQLIIWTCNFQWNQTWFGPLAQ